MISFTCKHTFKFVNEYLRESDQSILDVGCGSGELSLALSNEGFHVTAIDKAPVFGDSLVHEQVTVWHGDWLDFVPAKFDVVVFSRSLHHIHPLKEAIKKAKSCLSRGGRIIIDDFSAKSPCVSSLERMIEYAKGYANGVFQFPKESLLSRLLENDDHVGLWNEDHQHVSSAPEIRLAFDTSLRIIHESQVPYFFHYFDCGLQHHSDTHRYSLLKKIYDYELKYWKPKVIGRRWVVDKL